MKNKKTLNLVSFTSTLLLCAFICTSICTCCFQPNAANASSIATSSMTNPTPVPNSAEKTPPVKTVFTVVDRLWLYRYTQPFTYDGQKHILNEQGDYILFKLSKGRMEILRWVGHGESTLVIPDKIEGQAVEKVFIQEDIGVKNIVLADGIKSFEFDDVYEESGNQDMPRSDEFSSIETFTLGASFTGAPKCLSEGVFDSLKAINVSPNNKKIKSIDGVLFSKNGKKLLLYPPQKSDTYTVPKGTETIGAHAFDRISTFKKITFNKGLKKIQSYAFASCKNLTKVTFPTSVRTIGKGAFYDCKKLKTAVVNSKKTKLTARSQIHIVDNKVQMRWTRDFKNINIKAPKGSVAKKFAQQVKKLNKLLNLPKKKRKKKAAETDSLKKALKLKSVSSKIARKMTSEKEEKQKIVIKKYYPDAGNTNKYFSYYIIKDIYVKDYNILFITELSSGYGNELSIPNVIDGRNITDVVLMDFSSLEKIELADYIQNIFCMYPEYKHDGSDGLYKDAFTPTSMSASERDTLIQQAKSNEQKNPIKELRVGEDFQVDCLSNPSPDYYFGKGDKLPHVFRYTLAWACDYSTRWNLSEFPSLENVVVADDHKTISADEFGLYTKGYGTLLYLFPAKAQELTELTLRAECTSIQAEFKNATSLEKVVLHDGVTSIGDNVFSGCAKLSEITFGKGLTHIGEYAFRGTNISSVDLGQCTNIDFGQYAFNNCDNLKNVVLPSQQQLISHGMFASCDVLEKVPLPESVTTIKSKAFYNCKNLTEFISPSNLSFIGYGAFEDCVKLVNVKLSEKITYIRNETFRGCSSLESIVLPKSVKKVHRLAFHDCYSLTNVVIEGNTPKTWA